ncbi:MAG: type II/IV secretion system protein [Lentisphaeria bacterium]|nr:type II/IV secretion system protein [Lentisphaeria bacterium]
MVWVVVCFVCAGRLRAEEVPLYNGQVLSVEIVARSERGLDIRTGGGVIRRLRWDQIDRSFPGHPMHGKRYSYEGHGGGEEEGAGGVGGVSVRVRRSADPFGRILFVGIAWWWLCVLSVWRLSACGIYHGERQRWVDLAALAGGPFVAVPLMLKHRGLGGLLASSRRGLPPTEKDAPPCRFFTWDNQELKPKSSRRFSSGLALAEVVMARAVKAGASDVHLDTSGEGIKLSMRVDGVLRDPEVLELDLGRRAMTAIKMAAGMDLAKLQEAQDGGCHLRAGEDWFDLRVARAWAVNGETLVVRLLRAGGIGGDLAEMGMLPPMVTAAKQLTTENAGIIIMCGPTGSGKTTTIYALLRRIQGTGRNTLTIEDPVEYRLEHATQISLNPRLGATFASALKASMRHDPDVILVGEIRDKEAMDVAFQAALTGHLVFTTIHATSVLAAFGRLKELGLSAYMINTGLRAIVCQRLVRQLCSECREAYVPTAEEVRWWGIEPFEEQTRNVFYRPAGCRFCDQSGYRGRRGVYRMLLMNNNVRNAVTDEMATGELQGVVEEAALGTLADYAAALLWTGVTSPDELRKTLDMFDFGKELGHRHAV